MGTKCICKRLNFAARAQRYRVPLRYVSGQIGSVELGVAAPVMPFYLRRHIETELSVVSHSLEEWRVVIALESDQLMMKAASDNLDA